MDCSVLFLLRLTRTGMEGFNMIEDSHGWPRRSGRLPSTQVHHYCPHHHHQYQHQQTLIYQGPQITTVRMPVITSNEVVQYYGTMVEEPITASNAVPRYN